MGRIVIIEDDRTIRDHTARRLEETANVKSYGYPFSTIVTPEIPDKFPAEQMADLLGRMLRGRKGSYTVLVLDLCLGNHSDDGLEMMRYIRHFWDGAVVLHSSQTRDPAVRAAAVQLGLRFGCTKLADNLTDLVLAAWEVAFLRSATLGSALYYEQMPIPPWQPEPGLPSLLEYLNSVKAFGRSFDGTADSVNWELVDWIEETTKQFVRRSTDQSRFLPEWRDEGTKVSDPGQLGDQPYFYEEWWTNTIPVLMSLRQIVNRALIITTPSISFSDTPIPA